MMQFQKSDPIFNMEVDVKRSVYNFQPNYSVTMVTREEVTWRNEPPPRVNGFVWYTVDNRSREGTKAGVYGQSSGRRLKISPGKHVTIFDAEIYVFLFCTHEIHKDVRPEKYGIICSDGQAALKLFRLPKQRSHWYSSAQGRWLSYPCTILWKCFESPDILGFVGMKLPMSSQRRELFARLLDQNRPWGVSR